MTRFVRGSAPVGRIKSRAASLIVRRAWSALKLAQVRLRVPIVLVVTALLVGRWEVIRNHWDRLSRGTLSESISSHAVSADTEYFCPMDPGVISDWPGKCGICNMALVRRKRGEALALPDGVIARMQLSPYRIQLAGIRTAPATFRPLSREFESSGLVARDGGAAVVPIEIPARQAPWIAQGQTADIACRELSGRDPIAGVVQAMTKHISYGWEFVSATIAITDPPRDLVTGMIAVVRVQVPMAAIEPFCSLPVDPPQLLVGEPRHAYVCPNHLDNSTAEPSRCPIDRKQREPRPLSDYQRLRLSCPMHPNVTADQAGASCKACGMILVPRVISYIPAGQVLSVPQTAVVDAGARKVVFVENMPGMFDAVEVILGPRCGDSYPVVRGIEPGQSIAIAGAFLLDAETRLNPSLAAAYFGATRGERAVVPVPIASSNNSDNSDKAPALAQLAPEDRPIAEHQKFCPVTKKPLGSMGTLARIVVSGRVVFLCCDGCEDAIKRDPSKYLATLRHR